MKIKVGAVELPVKNFYPFRYSDGKMVLRFDVKQSNMDFQELREVLQENPNPIEFYQEEDDTKPACTYYGYSEFTALYEHETYSVEQVTPSTLQSAVEALQAKLKEQEEVLSQQTQVIQNQFSVIGTLTEGILEMSMEVYAEQQKPEAEQEQEQQKAEQEENSNE